MEMLTSSFFWVTLAQIIMINMPLGLLVVAIGASGRYWG